MSAQKIVRTLRFASERALRVALSAALVLAYVQVQLQAPVSAAAAPARLSVSASVSSKPLLGGKATVHVVVKNIDTTDKAYNISVEDTLTSSNTTAYPTFVSASDANGAVPPSVNALKSTPPTNLVLKFINIRDLAPQESYAMDIQVDLGPSAAWKVGDLLQNAIRASGNTVPNQTIPDISVTTNASQAVLPIIIQSKTANQSTGVEQATGTSSRQYSYTINVQNNYTGPTQSVVVVDKLPDGVEFLGMAPASTWATAPAQSRDASTGVTTLTWNLGTMATSAGQAIQYKAGIRYDYFGTNNGGKNRSDAATLTTSTAGAVIPDKTPLTNNVRLDASWLSSPASDTAAANVTAAYLTISKGQTPTSGGSINTTISYTLNYYNSQYYSILATTNSILVHDHLPDGQQFATATAVPAPTSTQHNPDGSTDVTWTVGAMAPTSDGTITFDAAVRQTWKEPGYAGDPVVSGDTMTNNCDIRGVYQDQVNAGRPQAVSTSAASSGYSTSIPKIYKAMKSPDDPNGPWLQNIDMSIGDTTTVRVQFNTKDGVTPERTNIDMGNIMLNDWLPAGMAIVPGTFNVTYSNASDFSLPTTLPVQPSLNISTPTTLTVSGLDGAQWYLGNVSPAGWWQATFDVVVKDVPAAADGVIVANLWKLTGYNTFGAPYSDRAAAMTINYAEPYLTLTKSVAPPSPLGGGSTVPYTMTLNNTGTGTAHQVSITDTLPVGMRATPPDVTSVKLDGSTLASGTDYVTSWDSASGTLGVLLQQGSVRTDVPGGSAVVVKYDATVDEGIGAGDSLVNTATVSYSSSPLPGGHVTPGTNNVADDNTDAATVTCDDLAIHKGGALVPGPDTLGGLFTYDVTFTVPPHDVAYAPTITDTIGREGVKFGGTATLTKLSGSAAATASFSGTSTPTKTTPAAGQTAFAWGLSTIDNSSGSSSAVFDLQFTVQDTGVKNDGTWEFTPPTGTDTFTDSARLDYKARPASGNRSITSNTVSTSVGQPVLSVTKNFNPMPAPLPTGGSTVNYRVTVTNTGTQPAYDVSVDDTLPLEASSAVLTAATLNAVDVKSQVATSFSAGPPPAMHFVVAPVIPAGQALVLDYTMTLGPAVAAGVALKNTVDADWDSIAGAPAGSRVYNDSPQEAYAGDSANQTVNAQSVTIVKTAPPGPLTLGDVATYTIDVTVPPDTLAYWPQITDLVYMRGTQYEPGTATITDTQGTPSVPATLAAGQPTNSVVGANRQFLFNLNDTSPNHAIDNTNQSTAYKFRLTFGVRVTGNQTAAIWDFPPPTTNMNLRDDGSIKWATANAASRAAAVYGAPVASNNKNTLLVQPLLKTVKTVPSGPGPYAGGSFIDYRVTVSNVGSSTAYELSLVDTLPVEVSSAVLTGATMTGVGSIASSVTASYLTTGQPHIQFQFDPSVTLAASTATITLDYRIQLQPTVGSGATLTNTVDANWWSLPSATTGARQYADLPQEGASWTLDTTSAVVSVAQVPLGKRVTSAPTTPTIGSIVEYTVEATVPANTTAYSLTMTDTVPPGLTVLLATGNAGLPAPAIVSTSAAGTLVVWNTGVAGVPNPPYTTATLTLLCQVRDLSYAGGPVPSGPVANAAQLSWRTQGGGGGSLLTTTSPNANFGVSQPSLTVSKTASVGSAGPGDTVTFTSVVSNTGTATAYTAKWNDVLPAWMSNPTLVSVTHSTFGALTSPADFTTSVAGNTLNVAFDQLASPANAIGPAESVTLVFRGTVNGGVHNATSMTDTATVSSYVSLPNTSTARTYGPVSAPRTVTALSPALVVTKSVVGSAHPLAGDTVHYRYTVKNVGTAPAHAVVATDALPADLTYVAGTSSATWPSAGSAWTADPSGGSGPTLAWDFGGTATLAPGETLTVNFDAVVAAAAPIGSRVNTVSAAATDGAGAPVPANCSAWIPADTNPTDSSTATVRICKPGMTVTKALVGGQDTTVQAGQPVGFKITVNNTGDTTLTTVPLSDTYDASRFTYASASVAPSSAPAGSIAWNSFGPIAPYSSRSVVVTFAAGSNLPSNPATNSALCAGAVDEFGHPLPNSSDTATVSITKPQVSVTKTLHPGQDATVQAGEAVGFDITVTNTGDTPLTTVPLTDSFSTANLTFASATTPPNSNVGGLLTWNNIGPLGVGASASFTVTFTAGAAPVGNLTTDTARVNGATDVNGDHPANVQSSAAVAITRPAVSLTKARHMGQDPAIQTSQTVTFDLVVKNTGDTTLTTVPLSDTWDAGYLLFSASAPPTFAGTGSAAWDAGPLAPSATTTVTLTLVALGPVPGLTTVDNAAISGARDVYGDFAPDTGSSASIDITKPMVMVTKTLHPGQDSVVQPGQHVGYDITVTNSGDTTLPTVPLADTYDPALLGYAGATAAPDTTAPAGSLGWNNTGQLAPGAARTITVTFTAEATAAVVTNTATVTGATDVNGDHPPVATASDSTLRITHPSVSIVKKLHPGQDPQIQPGQTATYDLTITNTGDTRLDSVQVTDVWDSAVFQYLTSSVAPVYTDASTAHWLLDPAALAPGDSTTISVTLTALGSPAGLDSPDQASAVAVDQFSDVTAVATATCDIKVTHPSVTVTKALHPGQDPVVQVGDTVAYDIGVTNSGNTTLTTVPLADTYDAAALQPVSANPAAADYGNDGALNWANVGPVAPGKTTTITVQFTALMVPAGQVTTDTATVTGATDVYADPVPDATGSASVRITAPGVSVSKQLLSDPAIQAGQAAVFLVTVTNTGDTTLATVPLSDSWDSSVLAPVIALPFAPDAGTPGTASWSNVGPLVPGQQFTEFVVFNALSNPPGQVTTNTVGVTSAVDSYGDSPKDATATATVKVTHPALTLTKSTHAGQDPAIQTSQTVTFDLVVENTGDTTLTTVPLSDIWDSNYLLFDSSAPLASATLDSASWALGPIAPGASQTVELTLVAIAPVPGLTTIDTATVLGAADENGDPANDAVSSAAIDVTKPAVSVVKTLHPGQDPVVQPGQPVGYDITITNSGDTTLAAVPLADTYDPALLAFDSATTPPDSTAPAGSLGWDDTGELAPAASRTITVTFTAETTAAVVTNTATVAGATDVNGDHPPLASAADSTLRITSPDFSLAKTLHPGQDPQIQPGQTATYDLTITNTGDTRLQFVELIDLWDPATFTYTTSTVDPFITQADAAGWIFPTDLASGESTSVSVTLTALSSPAKLDSPDEAVALAADQFGDVAPMHSADADILVTQPSVTVSKQLHPGQDAVVQVGQSVTYDVGVTNSGNTTLTAIPIADAYDSSALKPVSATPGTVDNTNDGTLDWTNVGPLAPGQTTTLTATFQAIAVPAEQVSTDTASATGVTDMYDDPAPDSSATASVRITAPSVGVVKQRISDDAAVQAGEPVTYRIVVTNTGDTTLVTVPLADRYDSAYLAYSSATPSEDTSSPGTIAWDNVGPLAPGQAATLTVTLTATNNPPGQVTTDTAAVANAVDAYGDSPSGVSSDASVKITHPSLTLSKVTAAGQDPYIQIGQTVTYDLTVANSGDTTLTSVPLTDSWDASYLTFSSATMPPATLLPGTASWTLGPIGPGDSETVSLTLLAAAVVPGYSTADTATVTGAVDENGDGANSATSSADISITRPAVRVTKVLHDGQDPFVQVGQTVTFDIGVTDVGDVELQTVPLSDAWDPGVFELASAAPVQDADKAGSAQWLNVGPLLPGATTTTTVTLKAIGTSGGVASVDTATVTNAVDIHEDVYAGDSAATAATVTRPELTVTKTLAAGQPATVKLGDSVTYDIVARNSGDTTLATVPLGDSYTPTQLEFVSALPTPVDSANDGRLDWTNLALPTPLAPGAQTTVTVTFKALQTGNDLVNIADSKHATDVNGDEAPNAGDMNTALAVFDPAALEVTKTADPVAGTIVLPGQTITYTLSWSNTGGVTMPGVVLTDPLPPSVTYVSGSLALGQTPLTDVSDADQGSYNPLTHTVSVALGDVGAESRGTATFKVVVAPENVSASGVMNTGYFRSAESTIATAGPVYHPVDPFTIVKTGKDLNGGTLKGGDVIEWTITVKNTGLTPTTHVIVTDTVPNTTTYVKGSIRGQGANDKGVPHLVWDIGTMAVGETRVLTFRSTVKKGLPSGTLIKNQALVQSDQSRPKKSDNPKTPTNGDPTILVARTSGSEGWRLPLAAGLLMMVGGLWFWPRRRKLAVENPPPGSDDRNGGGLDG